MTTVITREQGYTGFSPEIIRIVTTATLTQVTTAGWYNNSPISGESISNVDQILICYSYGSSSQATSLFDVSISASGVVTLSLGESNVITPTIANHIATYTNTSGTLSEDPATAISGGNIQAGLSGTAGALISFPGTASKGSFKVAGVANTGNTVTTLSNAAMGQTSQINIPDPANATGQLLIGATATPFVSGNFPVNSGTAGLMVDSGVSATAIAQTLSNVSNNHVTFTKVFTLTFTQLASAAKVNIVTHPSGTATFFIQDVKVLVSTGLSGGGGNRLLAISDGTTVFNNAGITAALLGTPIFTLWGGTGNPISAGATDISAAGADIYFQYTGGTTDYTAGSVMIAVTCVQLVA